MRKYIPFFKIYYDYCSQFQLNYVEQLKLRRNDFNIFVTDLEHQGDKLKGLTLESFLVKPVQQLPRYVIMFQQMLKYTESDHPDYKGIVEVIEQFQAINKKIDHMMTT